MHRNLSISGVWTCVYVWSSSLLSSSVGHLSLIEKNDDLDRSYNIWDFTSHWYKRAELSSFIINRFLYVVITIFWQAESSQAAGRMIYRRTMAMMMMMMMMRNMTYLDKRATEKNKRDVNEIMINERVKSYIDIDVFIFKYTFTFIYFNENRNTKNELVILLCLSD